MSQAGGVGAVHEVLTYLEMADPDELCAAPEVPSMTLRGVSGDLSTIRAKQEQLAAPHHWVRLQWSDAQWSVWLTDPRHRYWSIDLQDVSIGALELEDDGSGGVEISAFGLVPECTGKGLGGWALTLAVRTAWSMPVSGGAATRVWLYTSEFDHPRALPNYLRRGFTCAKTLTRRRDDLDHLVFG